jgi:hypothetical protein
MPVEYVVAFVPDFRSALGLKQLEVVMSVCAHQKEPPARLTRTSRANLLVAANGLGSAGPRGSNMESELFEPINLEVSKIECTRHL